MKTYSTFEIKRQSECLMILLYGNDVEWYRLLSSFLDKSL